MSEELSDEEEKFINALAEEIKHVQRGGTYTLALAGMISDLIDLKIDLAIRRLFNALKD